jgi:hypothetical protein
MSGPSRAQQGTVTPPDRPLQTPRPRHALSDWAKLRLVVDLAFAVNSHAAAARPGRASETYANRSLATFVRVCCGSAVDFDTEATWGAEVILSPVLPGILVRPACPADVPGIIALFTAVAEERDSIGTEPGFDVAQRQSSILIDRTGCKLRAGRRQGRRRCRQPRRPGATSRGLAGHDGRPPTPPAGHWRWAVG